MKIREVLEQVAHRPWPLPEDLWKYYQEWNHTVFLHWKVKPQLLKSWLSPQLKLDLFEDYAWISVVIFRMERIRPRGVPSFPPVSNFGEINIRTYVKYKGKQGVHFLSIEASNPLSSFIARKVSELPYRYSKMKYGESDCHSVNTEYQDELSFSFKIGDSIIQKSSLDIWLTERYALFQDAGSSMNAFDIHHVQWPLYSASITDLRLKYPRYNDLLKGGPDQMHYSPGVQVLAWSG